MPTHIWHPLKSLFLWPHTKAIWLAPQPPRPIRPECSEVGLSGPQQERGPHARGLRQGFPITALPRSSGWNFFSKAISGHSTPDPGPGHNPRASCVPAAPAASTRNSLVRTLPGSWAELAEGSRELTPPGETSARERREFAASTLVSSPLQQHSSEQCSTQPPPPRPQWSPGSGSPGCPFGSLPRDAPRSPSLPPCPASPFPHRRPGRSGPACQTTCASRFVLGPTSEENW